VNSRVVAPARGLRWLAEGWRMFRAAPLGWLALVFGYWLAMTVLSLIPLVGLVAASLLVPAFSVGFMAASRAASLGRPLELPMLFAGFRERVPAQLVLGAAYFFGLVAAIGASALADGGMLSRWMLTGQQPAPEAAGAAPLVLAMGAALLVYAPVMMMLWFSPLLVAWHAMAPAKALFYSFFACWLNWRAFLAYGFAALCIAFLLPAGVLLVLSAFAGAQRASPLALLLPLLLILLPTLLASFYASYRDVFEAKEGG